MSSPSQRHPRQLPRDFIKLVVTVFDACLRYRVMGLAAETAFYALLSLPPLFFGLAGAIGFIAKSFSGTTVAMFRDQILNLAARFLTPEALGSIVQPTLDDVLGNGRADVVSIGFLVALWSGSRAVAVVVDTCTIMYGARGNRGMVRSRILSLLLYIVMLAAGALLVPLVLAGPTLVHQALPHQVEWLAGLYWPVVIMASMAMLTSLFDVAIPIHQRWLAHLPGVVITVLTWMVGSWLTRAILVRSLGGASLYGPLAAPIGIMLWLYVFAFAILLGAAVNASVATVWPHFAGITRADESVILTKTALLP